MTQNFATTVASLTVKTAGGAVCAAPGLVLNGEHERSERRDTIGGPEVMCSSKS